MDFIKTSSLRALIELTFQRNWNGLIWMSRKGVITKRVKTVQTALSRKRPTAQTGRGTNVPRPKSSVRLKSRPKFKPSGRSRITTRETCPAVGQATTTHSATPREPGSNASRPRNLLAYHGRCIRPSREDVPRPAEKHRPIFTVRPQRPTANSVRPRPIPIVPTDRPNAPEARFTIFKPGLTLSRL
ncbi:unnamed protein product [Microthlaspi erraticum]|uniref:Uncharacterized protein n=1 Tax=Microthlaspi erraticum TaxID=1685480 RepID=A0A6D2LLY1_9BRAS|nr:unnamed protein product [Microthlaspi erraticum]